MGQWLPRHLFTLIFGAIGLIFLAVGGLLVWLSGVNLFAAIIPQALVGKVLTAIVAGGGASMLHDLFDMPEVFLEDDGDPDDGIPF